MIGSDLYERMCNTCGCYDCADCDGIEDEQGEVFSDVCTGPDGVDHACPDCGAEYACPERADHGICTVDDRRGFCPPCASSRDREEAADRDRDAEED